MFDEMAYLVKMFQNLVYFRNTKTNLVFHFVLVMDQGKNYAVQIEK